MKSLIANVTRRAATNEPSTLNELLLSILVAMSYPAVLKPRLFSSKLNSCVKYHQATGHLQPGFTLLAHPGVSLLLSIFRVCSQKIERPQNPRFESLRQSIGRFDWSRNLEPL